MNDRLAVIIVKHFWPNSKSEEKTYLIREGRYSRLALAVTLTLQEHYKNRLILLDVAKTILKNSGNMLIAKPVTRQASVT